MSQLDMKTPNLTDANIKKLGELFPSCMTETLDTEGKPQLAIDFDLLKQELSHSIVEGNVERYQLDWPGKRKSLLKANEPIAKTLRPNRSESVNFDETENLFIEGDNLEALKLLQESYLGKVKMIYIDPPYNTGNDFIYNDDFAEDSEEYFERSLQKDEEGNRLVANPESKGRYHSNWLSMMHSRLRLARNLLTDDGVIFISIDDNEQANLKRLCDEVFGENTNKTIVVKMSESSGLKMNSVIKNGTIPKFKEYVLVIKKTAPVNNLFFDKIPKSTWDTEYNIYLEDFTLEDRELIKEVSEKEEITETDLEYLDEIFSKVKLISPNEKYKQLNLKDKDKWLFENSWRICQCVTSASVLKLANEKRKFNKNTLFFVKSSTGILYLVRSDYSTDSKKPRLQMIFADDNLSLHPGDFWGHIKTTGLDNEGFVPFKNGKKPLALLKALLKSNIGNDESAFILDFFAGSSSSAEAVLQLNAELGCNLKFIQIQIAENLNESYALSSGDTKKQIKETLDFLKENNLPEYLTELGKERIRRAGKQILESDNINENWNKDIGFRVLKTDESNMKDVFYKPQALNQSQLFDQVDNVKEDRNAEDLLFQIMLDWGLELSLPVHTETIQGKQVYCVAEDALIACFDEGITEELVKELANKQPMRLLFRDNYYANNDVKINAGQLVKQLSPKTELKSI